MSESATWDASGPGERTDTATAALAIVENGVLAGMLGATVVALWFLLLDALMRQMPFYTPSVLGSIIFAGKEVHEVTAVDHVVVFAYTGLHGMLFLIAGCLLSFMFWHFEHNPQVGLILLLLFVTFEAIVWGVGVSVIPELAGAVGAWAIVVGNISAAVAMFALLLRRHPHARRRLRMAWEA